MRVATLALAGSAAGLKFPRPIYYDDPDYTFDFPETETEKAANWTLSDRCGQAARAGSAKDQRNDVNCPNVIVINTDDMSWADVTINNPSKLVPTPNIDKLVSKGINFRDGHSCTSRCAPSRYCLMTGRYHFRRGDYHYKPMKLEYGRKILPQLFKRNNYHTMVVGKPQPVEEKLEKNGWFFVEGTRFWGYDKSFTSRSYCCLPGGGYFENDYPLSPFEKWAIFTEFRDENEDSLWVQDEAAEIEFFRQPQNWHFLDGYYKDGNEENGRIQNAYKAYWSAIDQGLTSGLNDDDQPVRKRRRRFANGKLAVRNHRIHRRKRNAEAINEGKKPRELGRKNFLRFRNVQNGKVISAGYKITEKAKKEMKTLEQERANYEFAVDQIMFDTPEEAREYRQTVLDQLVASGMSVNDPLYKDMKRASPKRTQTGFDSKEIMYTFHKKAREYITESVSSENPITPEGEMKESNRPFFMYLSFRAPHRPSSHNLTFDENNPMEYYPHAAQGKQGEQFWQFDKLVGNVMKTLHDMEVADNTLIFFTSDNGPDQGAFNLLNRFGHVRMGTLRGKKASVYEGGHRVPFLSWWPLGTHRSLWGTNYDLPVSQIDLFSTFADIMNYPLPGGDKCTYAYTEETASEEEMKRIGRPKRLASETAWRYNRRVSSQIEDGKYVGPDTGYSAAIQHNGLTGYLEEKQNFGYRTSETWLTLETGTGFLVGWDGCMAEDSQSFAAAFRAVKVASSTNEAGERVHHFMNEQQQMPAKIFAGKLGDLAIRFGRYKFVRFNAPKDLRTGITRQHGMIDNEGDAWHAAEGTDAQCRYNADGSKINPSCTVEAECREHTTWGSTFCMRDHFYQLWDLEENFGEKTFCSDDRPANKNPNMEIESAILGAIQERKFQVGNEEKEPEKPTDPYGVGLGVESTPVGRDLNDCCILNLDERQKFLKTVIMIGNNGLPRWNCATARIKIGGVEKDGGDCKEIPAYMPGETTFGLQDGSWEGQQSYFTRIENRFLGTPQRPALNYAAEFGWTPEIYFKWPQEDEWTPGYGCSNMLPGLMTGTDRQKERYIWDENVEGEDKWRTITHADRLCYRGKDGTDWSEEEIDGDVLDNFTLGCKVPAHNGALGEGKGFEGNPKYHADTPLRHKPHVAEGELDPDNFGKWFDFANCLKSVMSIIEGQALFPEAKNVKEWSGKIGYSQDLKWDEKPFSDDGTLEGNQSTADSVLSGQEIGASNLASARQAELLSKIMSSSEAAGKRFHGAGTRFIEPKSGVDSLITKCARFLPADEQSPYDIKPEYDMEMNLMGYYNTADNSGGSNQKTEHKLVWTTETDSSGKRIYRDDRPVMKYYSEPVLKGFETLY